MCAVVSVTTHRWLEEATLGSWGDGSAGEGLAGGLSQPGRLEQGVRATGAQLPSHAHGVLMGSYLLISPCCPFLVRNRGFWRLIQGIGQKTLRRNSIGCTMRHIPQEPNIGLVQTFPVKDWVVKFQF